jgi:prepilin-type N-terminal cleavage/methylation domain-containing protein
MHKNKAFTLIELIIVIGIIGALIAVTLGFLQTAQNRGKDAGKIQDLIQTKNALQTYATDNGGFPGQISDLITENYIKSLNPALLYTGKDNNGGICSTPTCFSYHLAIPLADINSQVLSSDSNITDSVIDGKSSNCKPGGGTTNLCYDVTP